MTPNPLPQGPPPKQGVRLITSARPCIPKQVIRKPSMALMVINSLSIGIIVGLVLGVLINTLR